MVISKVLKVKISEDMLQYVMPVEDELRLVNAKESLNHYVNDITEAPVK